MDIVFFYPCLDLSNTMQSSFVKKCILSKNKIEIHCTKKFDRTIFTNVESSNQGKNKKKVP